MVETVTETTAEVEPHLRWSFWKDTAMAAVDGTRLDAESTFDAHRTMASLTSGMLVDTASGPVYCRRPARKIAQDGDDGVCLMLLREGRGVIDQRGLGESALPAGDLKLFDLARPYAVAVPAPYRETRLYVPRGVFAERVGSIDGMVGLQIPAASPLTRLFSQYVAGLLASLPAMTRAEADAGMDGALHLLSRLVAAQTEGQHGDEDHLSADAVSRLADRHIADLLGDPGLDVETLARALGVSRSKLYRAFEGRGGVATAIRNARLDRVKQRLSQPAFQQQTLQAMAFECGFRDYTVFARAFRDRFGMSARDARKR